MFNPLSKTSAPDLLKKTAAATLLIIMLGVAFWVRSFTFWLPHWTGDQSQYIALAMKMNHTKGLSGYNLLEVDVRSAEPDHLKGIKFAIPTYVKGSEGGLAQSYHYFGLSYYAMPFWYKAPLLPMMLKWSHNLFLGPEKPFVVPVTNIGKAVWKIKPKALLESQLWLVVVPLMASLGTLVMVYFFCRCFAGIHTALIAVFIAAFNPVAVFCSNRVWTEDLQAFFLWAGILAYWKSLNTKRVLLPVLAGCLLGCSILTNQKSITFIPGLWLYCVLSDHKLQLCRPKTWIRLLFQPTFFWIAVGCALVTHQWFLEVYRRYGSILWQPKYYSGNSEVGKLWLERLHARPHSAIVYIAGGIYLWPPIAFGYASILLFIKNALKMISGQIKSSPIAFLWVLMLPFVYIMMIRSYRSAEHRYLVTILPALSISAAVLIEKIGCVFEKYTVFKKYIWLGVWIFLIGSAVWSVPIAWKVIMEGRVLIEIPF